MTARALHRRRRHRHRAPPPELDNLVALPGTVATEIRTFRFGAGEVQERSHPRAEDAFQAGGPSAKAGEVVWYDVRGLGSAEALQQIGRALSLHVLTVEDILHTHQRPKHERFEHYEYVVVRVTLKADAPALQLSLVLGEGFLASFCERQGDFLEPVRARLRRQGGALASTSAGYLLYAILDAVIDGYFPVLDVYADRLDRTESHVLHDPTREVLPELYTIKEGLRACRRGVAPLRDLLNALARDDHPLMTQDTRLHLRDCHDHVIQLLESIDSERDNATALMELHVSNVGNRMNEVMKVLTVIATLFIPLSFIAGVYGMNFDPNASPWNMPELRWAFGYPMALALMALVASGLLFYFFRRGWLSRSPGLASLPPGPEPTAGVAPPTGTKAKGDSSPAGPAPSVSSEGARPGQG